MARGVLPARVGLGTRRTLRVPRAHEFDGSPHQWLHGAFLGRG